VFILVAGTAEVFKVLAFISTTMNPLYNVVALNLL